MKVLYKIDKRSKSIPLNVNDRRKYFIYKQGGVNICGDISIKKLVSFWSIENDLPWGAGLLEGTFIYAFYAHINQKQYLEFFAIIDNQPLDIRVWFWN